MHASERPGEIEPGKLYTAQEARDRLRIGVVGWRKLRRAGLPVIQRGRQVYVFSDDVLRLFREGQLAPQPGEEAAK